MRRSNFQRPCSDKHPVQFSRTSLERLNENSRELPAVLQAVQRRMMNEWQWRGGMERKCVECRLKEVGSERSAQHMVTLTHFPSTTSNLYPPSTPRYGLSQ